MVPFAGYELPVLYEEDWGGIVKGACERLCAHAQIMCGVSRLDLSLSFLPPPPFPSAPDTHRAPALPGESLGLRRLPHGADQVRHYHALRGFITPPPNILHSPTLETPPAPFPLPRWFGKDRVKFLETLVVGDIAGLGAGEARLSLLTNKDGGIIDDTIITNAGDYTCVCR